MNEDEPFRRIAAEWHTAKEAIKTALRELYGRPYEEQATSILSRLAHAGILIQSKDDAEKEAKNKSILLDAINDDDIEWILNQAIMGDLYSDDPDTLTRLVRYNHKRCTAFKEAS